MTNLSSWKEFSRDVRLKSVPFLSSLESLSDVVLVAGCQRSGTTVMTNLLLSTGVFEDYLRGVSVDSELLGALILSGQTQYDLNSERRFCFQTTYLNERFHEYFEHIGSYKLIYILRNPFSVIFSMLNNWGGRFMNRRFALNELFEGCGAVNMSKADRWRYALAGVYGISRIKKACYSYNAKIDQAYEIKSKIGSEMLVIDYDSLVSDKHTVLPIVFDFIGLEYKKEIADIIRAGSLSKAKQLPSSHTKIIQDLCITKYQTACSDLIV